MQANSNSKISLMAEHFPQLLANNALKSISTEDFAALGADRIVFARALTGEKLGELFPEAAAAVPNDSFNLLMTAGGVPVLVTDSDEAIADWLEQHEVTLVQRH